MIHVIASIHIHEGHRDAFIEKFEKLVPQVRAEEGCIEYGAAVDIQTSLPAQQPVPDGMVTVLEKWESIEALEHHLVAPHMTAYRDEVKDLVDRIELRILEPTSLD